MVVHPNMGGVVREGKMMVDGTPPSTGGMVDETSLSTPLITPEAATTVVRRITPQRDADTDAQLCAQTARERDIRPNIVDAHRIQARKRAPT